jgi:chromosome segregation ATPase
MSPLCLFEKYSDKPHSTSRITVKLKNGGEGYRRDQYGDEIVIERNFSREGSSNYKLRSKNGRIVSSKREELDNITDFYGLQVDNPMTILTQDAARQFLSNSSNADKYKFFNKGVQLEQLDQDYSLVRTAIGNAEAMSVSKQEAIAELLQQLTIAEQKVKQMESQDNLRNQIDLLGKQMTWAQVNECQVEVEKSQRLVESMRDKISRVEGERDRTSTEFDEAHRELEAANQKIKIEKEKLTPFEDERTALKEKFDKNRVDLMGIQVGASNLVARRVLIVSRPTNVEFKERL